MSVVHPETAQKKNAHIPTHTHTEREHLVKHCDDVWAAGSPENRAHRSSLCCPHCFSIGWEHTKTSSHQNNYKVKHNGSSFLLGICAGWSRLVLKNSVINMCTQRWRKSEMECSTRRQHLRWILVWALGYSEGVSPGVWGPIPSRKYRLHKGAHHVTNNISARLWKVL